MLDHLGSLFELLAAYPQHHARSTAFYRFIDGVTKLAFHEAKPEFEAGRKVAVAELGFIDLPYTKMGAVDSIDLFGLDELMIFAFYHRNRGRYARAADIGANIGLHSIVLARCGSSVESFEPDPLHHALLVRNLARNGVTDGAVHQAAVSGREGRMPFVRVLGNTTGSHLAGSKVNPYGNLERFDVDVVDIREVAKRVDLLKIDAEGHEAVILAALPVEAFDRIDAFVEIGSPENARALFDRFAGTAINVFAQKCGWRRVERAEDVPVGYREGGVFVSVKPAMPW